jgi:pimeloyl-ACP methyl ester carboxylesterase
VGLIANLPDVRHTPVHGHAVAYRQAGEGPPLVFLHGFTLDSRIWRPQFRDLSDQFTVIAWDAPGSGASSDPRDPFTMTDWANCLAGLLDVLAVRHAHIIGMSWGGVLAQEFYRLYPERTCALVLAGTYAGWRGSLPAAVCSNRLAACMHGASLPADEFARQWVPGLIGGAASQKLRGELLSIVSDLHPQGFRLMARALHDADTTSLLPRIQVPTLLIWGDDDRRSPLTIAQQLQDAIPSSELVVIPHSGHVTNMEQSDAFTARIRRFCAGAC